LPGRIWTRLGELGFIDSSLQFAALFTLSFIPFLLLLSVVLGKDLPRALAARSEFNAEASHDVITLFAHGRTALTSLSVIGIVLVIFGAESVSRILQTWYAKIFRAEIHGSKALVGRVAWLAGVFGFVALQFVIGRRLQPHIGHIMASGAQFFLSVAFWWWTLHCLLAGRITWRRLFPAGLVTAICYTGVGIYVAVFGSSSIVSNQARYGPIGAVMTLLTIEVGLGVALHLGAVIGAVIGRDRGRDLTSPSATCGNLLDAGPAAGNGRRGREGDVDGEAALGPGQGSDDGAVGGGDRADDGQAEAVAAVAPGGTRAEPLEGLEQAVDLGGGDDRPGVGHRQDGAAVAGPGGDSQVPVGDVVPDGVVDQVGH
jgi:membrane protein